MHSCEAGLVNCLLSTSSLPGFLPLQDHKSQKAFSCWRFAVKTITLWQSLTALPARRLLAEYTSLEVQREHRDLSRLVNAVPHRSDSERSTARRRLSPRGTDPAFWVGSHSPMPLYAAMGPPIVMAMLVERPNSAQNAENPPGKTRFEDARYCLPICSLNPGLRTQAHLGMIVSLLL
jgi:hypothetical protein